mmetsp:Transcript_12859/g.16560  ORF Transcript_12859/g.16560 Transcript_12859/m.16560 type:complete len:84 (+) Transcript_12859:214-465(+)
MTADKKFVFGDVDVYRHLIIKRPKFRKERMKLSMKLYFWEYFLAAQQICRFVGDELLLLGSFKAINQNKRPFLKINVRVAPHI